MIFAKYAFLDAQDWATYQSQIQTENGYTDCAVVEIGNICLATDADGNCTDLSPLHAVDILWFNEPLDSFSAKEVFPSPIGVHTFSGCEALYTARFCQFNPDSPYCTTPE
jgi:hypothetical protein